MGRFQLKQTTIFSKLRLKVLGSIKCFVDMVLKSDKKGELILIFSNSWSHLFYEDFPREIQG